jgi:hypothetical protein
MVVITVAATIGAVAVGSFGGAQRKSAARQLARDLTFARSQAMLTGRTVWVTFDVVADAYALLIEPLDGGGRDAAAALTDPATGREFRQAVASLGNEGVTLDAVSFDGVPHVGFDWKGRPKLDDLDHLLVPGVITLSGATVTVTPDTGLASWQ